MPDAKAPPDARIEPARTLPRGKCRNCLKIFAKTRPWKRFCNSKCRNTFHNDNRNLEKIDE